MRIKDIAIGISVCAMIALAAVPSSARNLRGHNGAGWGDCVRTVRSMSDFDIRGDAWMWWQNSEGRYSRSNQPQVGSVLVFKRTSHLGRGHVSLVSGVVDHRTVLVDHTWIAGRGIRYGMKVQDVSPNNDWSQVRVWHGPTDQLGQRVYPIYGFILPEGAKPSHGIMSVADRGNDNADTSYSSFAQEDDVPVSVAPAGRQRQRAQRHTVMIGRSNFRAAASAMLLPMRKPEAQTHARATHAQKASLTTGAHGVAPKAGKPAKAHAAKAPAAPKNRDVKAAAAAPQKHFSPARKPTPVSAHGADAPAHKPVSTKKQAG